MCLELLFERVGEPRFELDATPPEGTTVGLAHRLTIDLETLTLPVTFRWIGAEWSKGDDPSPGAASVSLEWHRGAGIEEAPPFEQDPELRRQLEALGYLD